MEVRFSTDKYGNKQVSIEDGNRLFDEWIEAFSNNGEYCAAAGTWTINDEDSDNYGDEIEGSETLIVFRGNEVAYAVKGFDSIDKSDAVLRDDGSMFILGEDDDIITIGTDGKKSKKKIPLEDWFDYEINQDFFWIQGDDANLNLKLFVLLFDTAKSWSKRLPKNISSVETVFISEDGGVIALCENDDDEFVELKYAPDGKKAELSRRDYKAIELKKAELRKKWKAEKAEEARIRAEEAHAALMASKERMNEKKEKLHSGFIGLFKRPKK